MDSNIFKRIYIASVHTPACLLPTLLLILFCPGLQWAPCPQILPYVIFLWVSAYWVGSLAILHSICCLFLFTQSILQKWLKGSNQGFIFASSYSLPRYFLPFQHFLTFLMLMSFKFTWPTEKILRWWPSGIYLKNARLIHIWKFGHVICY